MSLKNHKGFFGWVGGKKQLRKKIAPLIPADIKTYIEPFGGAGWVLFYKDKWADYEIYNDLDGRLVNLFRIVKYHPNAFKEELKYLLGSREIFFQFMNGTFITDIQKAVQFFFIVTRSFGAKCEAIGLSKKRPGGIAKSFINYYDNPLGCFYFVILKKYPKRDILFNFSMNSYYFS